MMTFYAAAGSYQIRSEDGKNMPYIMRLGKLQPVSIPEFSLWSMLLWDVLTYEELHKKFYDKMEETEIEPSSFDKSLEMLVTSGTVPYIASEIPDDPRDITPEQWEAMKAVDIRTVDKSQLVDLSTVHIDESLPVRERVLSYLKQVKNPYCVRVGNFAVKVKYKEDGPSFEEVFKHLLQQQSMM